jgi:hypothetical protein
VTESYNNEESHQVIQEDREFENSESEDRDLGERFEEEFDVIHFFELFFLLTQWILFSTFFIILSCLRKLSSS